jgi:hypothetical protein
MISTTEVLDVQLVGAPSNSPAVLSNHRTQSAAAINGWQSALFGLPFMAVGAGIAIQGLNAVHSRRQSPDWLVGLLAGMFFSRGSLSLFTVCVTSFANPHTAAKPHGVPASRGSMITIGTAKGSPSRRLATC